MHIVHHVVNNRTSRTRIKVPKRAAKTIAQHLKGMAGVKRLSVNDATGSITVNHDSDLDDLICEIEAEGICALTGLPEGAGSFLTHLGPHTLSMMLFAAIAFVGPKALLDL